MTSTKAHFVIGTDTGVGKTLVACALIHAMRMQGIAAVGMKPVASGAWQDSAGTWHNDDVDALASVSVPGCRAALTNPYLFEAPLAPHIAARNEGRLIEPERIFDAFHQLCDSAQHVVVEGVGGFLVPLAEDFTTADLAQALGAPVVLVVGLRLGCINHALLTFEAVRARGLRLAGWVANCLPDGMLEQDETIAALAERLQAPLLGILPRLSAPDPDRACEAMDIAPLLQGAAEICS